MSDTPPNHEPKLWMITGEVTDSSTEGEKAGGVFKGGVLGDEEPTEEKKGNGKASISVNKLQKNLNQFLGVVGDLFLKAEEQAQITQSQDVKEEKSGVKLDQIEFSVAVNGEGEVGFWGLAQGKVGGTTEIKLTFKRQEG